MQLSPSKITLYADCSLRWKFHYIDQIKKPVSSIHLVYGSAIHKALETLNLSLLNNEDLHLENAFQAYEDCWLEGIEEQKIRLNQYTYTLYEMGLKALEKFYNESVDYEVIATEFPFEVPIVWPDRFKAIENCENYTLRGIIDAIIKRKDKIIVVDYKTSKEKYNRFKLDSSIQLAIYAYAFRHMLSEGAFPDIKHKKENAIAYHVFLKDYENLDGEITLQKKKITDSHLNRMFYIIAQTINGIENSVFIPNFQSTCKWCEFKKECLNFL